ncbi:hypothetical protein L2E82_36359 [Cichorium intybus]|uniref:Uncharacterized protein n=1 Tax=Cichorium intybus TaxID=13427 RepID=A0ACB9BRG2_CICIN|nr:hypothetical protein L2E82_36359 [Cichorium intybus]
MASFVKVRDGSGDSDDGITDNESLDATLEEELAGGMNYTQDDEFLNVLCDNDKLAKDFVETLRHEGEEQVLEIQAEVVDEVVYETQTINDLRESGYNEDEIAKCVPPELVEEEDEEGIEETQPVVIVFPPFSFAFSL